MKIALGMNTLKLVLIYLLHYMCFIICLVFLVIPNGMSTGLDIGFSNLSLQTISLSFYTMCKSTTPMFLLLFSFIMKLEMYLSYISHTNIYIYIYSLYLIIYICINLKYLIQTNMEFGWCHIHYLCWSVSAGLWRNRISHCWIHISNDCCLSVRSPMGPDSADATRKFKKWHTWWYILN